ncbi:MAG: NYN domain-containing protein [Candidatus Aminicenantia bacterium]
MENEELRILISGSGESADELIREMLETQLDCRNFILVSSDRELRYQAKIRRAKIITSPQFIKILNRQLGKSRKEERNHVLSSLEVKLWENIFKRKDNETKKTLKIPFRRKG